MTEEEAWDEWYRTSVPSEVIGLAAMMRSAFQGGFSAGQISMRSLLENDPEKEQT